VTDELDRELAAVGVPARRRRRIRHELEDHLACDPSADLGDPRALARQFADELGTAYARRGGLAVFVALVPIGLLACVLARVDNATVNVGTVFGGQLAFVGGMLALLRAWRLRRERVISAAESLVIRRRALLGLAGGALTLASLRIAAGTTPESASSTDKTLVAVTIGVGALTLAGAAVALLAARLRPAAAGTAGDLSFDLGIDTDPWRLAFAIAGLVALCIAVAGVVQADPFDGLVRAVGDGILCLAGFALLGGLLGLRRQVA
jgi:hypothetical protein